MSAEDAYNEANRHYRSGEFSGAVQSFTQAIALNSNEWKYYLNRALAFLNLKKFAEKVEII